jgi:glyoxylase-like metal-dependent hydrolase (beta-lactamase superfamily II)
LSRRRLLRAGVDVFQVGAVGSLGSALLPIIAARAQPGDAAITTTELGGPVVLQAAGSNVVALSGSDGALMIDGGLAANADNMLQAVLAATGNDRIHTLINTHWHPEQTGANEAVGRSGGLIFAHEKTAIYLSNPVYSVTFEGRLEALPEIGRPTEVTRGDGSLEFAGTHIDYGYLPAAHTDGDLFLHFPEANVLVAGGVVSGERWPLLDYRNGAWFGGRVRALQRLAEVVDPDTRVGPADGRLITGRDIVRQRDINLDLFETMIGYMNRGFGPEDAAASNPLAQYQDEFGDPSAFLYGAYRSMLIAYVPD